jgi:hypothetical protein
MGERPKSTADYVHELNSRILQNPERRMDIIREFYSERVEAGDRETADTVLTIRSIIMASPGPNVPNWLQPAGLLFGGLTLLFFMLIVMASIFGYKVPPEGKFPLVVVLALGGALSASFLTGDAAASGKIPFFGNQHPLTISATGGFATLIILFGIGYYIYLK